MSSLNQKKKKKNLIAIATSFTKCTSTSMELKKLFENRKKSTSEVKDYKGRVNEGNHEQKLDIDKQKEYSSVIVTSG